MTSVSPWFVAIAVVLAVNPLRLQGRLPLARVVGWGVLIASIAYLALGAVATVLVEAIDVSPPTMRIAAGLVLIVGAARDLLLGPPELEPSLPGAKAAVIPVALPMLVRPHVAVLAVSIGASDGLAPLAAGAALTAVITMWVARPRDAVAARVLSWSATTTSVVAVAMGVALAVEGVFSV